MTEKIADLVGKDAVIREATRKVIEQHAHMVDCFIVSALQALKENGIEARDCELVLERSDGITTKWAVRVKEKP